MSRPAISVALCTFRGRAHLSDQLRSILTQQRQPDELVVCDDASGDGTLELACELLADAPFTVCQVVNKRNLGSSASFARAIDLCTGDIIVLCDQDDIWELTKLAVIEQSFTSQAGLSMLFSNGAVITESGKPTGYDLWASCVFTRSERRLAYQQRLFHVLLRHNVVTGATMAFRRSLCELVLPIGNEWVHDEWIALLAAATHPTMVIDRNLIRYRYHGAQQIGAPRNTLMRQIRTAADMGHDWFEREVRKLERVTQRLEARCPKLAHVDALDLIRRKIDYLRIRSAMRTSAGRCFLSSLRLYLDGTHARFGYGLKSLAQD
jgi:glycosyltransferase involved in cell wall biosynthesis